MLERERESLSLFFMFKQLQVCCLNGWVSSTTGVFLYSHYTCFIYTWWCLASRSCSSQTRQPRVHRLLLIFRRHNGAHRLDAVSWRGRGVRAFSTSTTRRATKRARSEHTECVQGGSSALHWPAWENKYIVYIVTRSY